MTTGPPKSPNNVTCTFFNQYISFRKTSISNMEAPNFLPQAPFNIVTSLLPSPSANTVSLNYYCCLKKLFRSLRFQNLFQPFAGLAPPWTLCFSSAVRPNPQVILRYIEQTQRVNSKSLTQGFLNRNPHEEIGYVVNKFENWKNAKAGHESYRTSLHWSNQYMHTGSMTFPHSSA